jgi:acyl phosphate:glycerol-3-phosphate acyltransferase
MDFNQVVLWAGGPVVAYLIGSIPFGLILARIFAATDLRRIGSGNIGATNARRAGGWGLGIATLACDMLKGAVPVYLAVLLMAGKGRTMVEVYACIAALAAFLGHLYPVYLRFKTGGKGVATAAGCFAVLSPPSLAVAFIFFLAVAVVLNRVSAASLAAAVVLPMGAVWAEPSWIPVGCAMIMSAIIILRHRDNIFRLASGTEPVIWRKKRKK